MNGYLQDGDLEKALTWAIGKSKEAQPILDHALVTSLGYLPQQLWNSLYSNGFYNITPIGPGRYAAQVTFGDGMGGVIIDVPWFHTVAKHSPLDWPKWATFLGDRDPYKRLMALVAIYLLDGGE